MRRLVEEESTRTVMAGLREVVQTRGLFCALYSDRGSHFFHTPKAGEPVDHHRLTQVGRALRKLGIQMIPAYSPQARGRCERTFGTWQNRLPQELRLAGIRGLDEANRFLRECYIHTFNGQFARPAEVRGTAFRCCGRKDLDCVFSIQTERVVAQDNTVAIRDRWWQIEKCRWRHSLAGQTVRVHDHLDGKVTIRYGPHVVGQFDGSGSALRAATKDQRRGAELASVFLAAERGILHDPEQHAAYVGSWIKTLKEDKNEIFRSAHDASRAADFLLALERDRSIAREGLRVGSELDSPQLGGFPSVVLAREPTNRGRDRGDRGWGLRSLQVPAERHLADRRWDALEPRVWDDNAMLPETIRQGLTPVEPCDRPTPMHFEMAYQARVASDRIRFAIKHLEQFALGSEPAREISLQLLDALDRFEELDRQFQTTSRMGVLSRSANGTEVGT